MDTDNSRALVSTDVDKVMAVVEATGLSKAKLAQVKAAMDELKLSMLSIIDSVDIKLSELDTKLGGSTRTAAGGLASSAALLGPDS